MWTDFPKRGNRPDTGIDLVAQERATGDYCAIQCKFYDPTHTLDKSDIDSFFTASGKAQFQKRMIVSTTDKWGKNAEDAIKNQQIPVARLRVQDLADSPVDWSQFSLKRPQDIRLKPQKEIRPHQDIALRKVVDGFSKLDRGKLIMACGTGKTFTALKIAEQFAISNPAQILFLVPSISLPDVWNRIKQGNKPKLPDSVSIFLSTIGGCKASPPSYEYQDDLGMNTYANRSITDDLSFFSSVTFTKTKWFF